MPNLAVVQPAMGDQVMDYTPIMHAGQTETIIQNVDMTAPVYIFTPGTTPVTIQIPTNDNTMPPSVIEIPMQTDIVNEVSEIYSKNKASHSRTIIQFVQSDPFPSIKQNKNPGYNATLFTYFSITE